jgi:hypothetical protein
MAIILRIDVDSPYGKKNLLHHFFSRIASDFNLRPILILPYLTYLLNFVKYLNEKSIRGYFFFRRCTLPTNDVLNVLRSGRHIIGLHLENSRSFDSFKEEVETIENCIKTKAEVFTKHGSGKYKYGLYHYPAYEPDKYLEWGTQLGMNIFYGNLEDPAIPSYSKNGLLCFPAAFWLEHHWRDTESFNVEWLINESKKRDIILLIHIENIINNKKYFDELELIFKKSEFKVL